MTSRSGVLLDMTKLTLALALLLAACGPKHSSKVGNSTGSGDEPVGPTKPSRTELERRRDAACETLGPRITSCAVEDAKKDLAAGKVTQKQFDQDTASGVLKKNTEEFIKACEKTPYSSRQVRVLEVCQKEETECEPMLSCLENLNKQ